MIIEYDFELELTFASFGMLLFFSIYSFIMALAYALQGYAPATRSLIH